MPYAFSRTTHIIIEFSLLLDTRFINRVPDSSSTGTVLTTGECEKHVPSYFLSCVLYPVPGVIISQTKKMSLFRTSNCLIFPQADPNYLLRGSKMYV